MTAANGFEWVCQSIGGFKITINGNDTMSALIAGFISISPNGLKWISNKGRISYPWNSRFTTPGVAGLMGIC
ncbi:MAG: hypothetical protein HRU05_07640 [Oceanospirillaceae bacterium]|nr:hypothetical protein [Oceanospirillaceae bacterium]